MDICQHINELRNAGATGLERYEQNLRDNERDVGTLENLGCEGRAALMFLCHGWQVVLTGTDSPDLKLNLDGEVVYAEVTRILQKSQDKLNEQAMLNPPDGRLTPLPNATGQPEPWEQIADVAVKKAHQYVADSANVLVVESDSESFSLTCETAAYVYDERAYASDDLRLRRLSGIMLVNRSETKCGPIPSNVEFCRTECAAVPLNEKLTTALNSIHLG
jgi:hypothetical protein